jgi:hypothetical protein
MSGASITNVRSAPTHGANKLSARIAGAGAGIGRSADRSTCPRPRARITDAVR